ncbi:MAG TPA: T9SS type A sorting domain-containing protein [Bacteroidetes bacterium]|nr:hypothetical protein BMS3Bbin04_00563 [bacterium BMS3Bbin04]HDO66542.1 T9SS type A sorting domain-containing protein [Bacteroidota bacterium]HEX05667.1 T9SS type A sorting domain-containing protein [Bacteroidota bacterium]
MKTIALILGLTLIAGGVIAQPPPTNLHATHDGEGTVLLTWNAPGFNGPSSMSGLVEWPTTLDERLNWTPPDPDQLLQQWENLQNSTDELDDLAFYFVYRNGSPIEIVYETSFEDHLPQTGTYIYTVTAFHDEGESEHTPEVAVTWYEQVNFAIDEDFEDGDIPIGWTVEATIASYTWHVGAAPFAHQNEFPTNVMFVDSDGAGSGPHLQERLILPNFDFSLATFVELEYSWFMTEYIEEHCYVQYRVDGGDWQTIADYSEDGYGLDVVHDLTIELVGESDADISFYYDDLDNWGYYFGIDDVEVRRDAVQEDPVVLDVIGMATTIQPSGGVVGFDLHITSQINQTFNDLWFWSNITLPNGSETANIIQRQFNLTPFMDVSYLYLQQEVPPEAPAGDYSYKVYVGQSLQNALLEDSFTFTKLGAANEMDEFVFDPSEWELHGLTQLISDETAVILPSEYALEAAWPNPFNAMTTLTLQLPENAPVTVTAYNVMGREVAMLVDNVLPAGSHEVVFDARDLASGVYFVRADVPDQFSGVQKLVLMK